MLLGGQNLSDPQRDLRELFGLEFHGEAQTRDAHQRQHQRRENPFTRNRDECTRRRITGQRLR
jgi:hypothetical protein